MIILFAPLLNNSATSGFVMLHARSPAPLTAFPNRQVLTMWVLRVVIPLVRIDDSILPARCFTSFHHF